MPMMPIGKPQLASDVTTAGVISAPGSAAGAAVDARFQGVAAEIIGADPTLAAAAALKVEEYAPAAVASALSSVLTQGVMAVSYGDSITQVGGYQPYVTARLTLAAYVNRGVSGRSMADGTANGAGTVTTVLANNDHAAYGLVTIAAGTNDFRLNVPLGTLGTWATTPLDRNTFFGAYRTAIDHVLAQNPRARIVLCTPLKRNNAGYTDESTNTAGHKLRDYAQAVRDIATMYGLPICDWYADSGFSERTLAALTLDGLHPNDAGNARLGRFMGDYLASILGIVPPKVLVSDTFTRGNATTLGNAESGQPWLLQTTTSATWGITDGRAHQIAGTTGFCSVDSGANDVRVRSTLGAVPTSAGVGGIAAWVGDGSNGLYLVATATSYVFGRRSAGVNTNLQTLNTAPQAGDVLEIVTVGTVVRALVNGVLIIEHPNLTAPAPTTKVGFYGSNPTGGPRFDDITVYGLAA
ncbi:SGNH/GDSL hydrolase family protein [Microbacterium sp. 3J1]|uniref:SGNH/GDSL hydrolase family protein n=1 Tax=Microbacterium sp. 3J1 TaxID=861269 RepID=UPI000A719A7E|nr:SGNH/GDSL hydrolase family protein [Microbacterium sp. 3J1]